MSTLYRSRWWWYYPTSFEGWRHEGTPGRPNSRVTANEVVMHFCDLQRDVLQQHAVSICALHVHVTAQGHNDGVDVRTYVILVIKLVVLIYYFFIFAMRRNRRDLYAKRWFAASLVAQHVVCHDRMVLRHGCREALHVKGVDSINPH